MSHLQLIEKYTAILYLRYLLSQGFIGEVKMGNPMVTYQVTESGLKLLKAIDSLMEMLGPSEDNKF